MTAMAPAMVLGFERLHLDRPAVDAAPVAVADWYEAKARLFEQFTEVECPAAVEIAAAAQAHADRLRRTAT